MARRVKPVVPEYPDFHFRTYKGNPKEATGFASQHVVFVNRYGRRIDVVTFQSKLLQPARAYYAASNGPDWVIQGAPIPSRQARAKSTVSESTDLLVPNTVNATKATPIDVMVNIKAKFRGSIYPEDGAPEIVLENQTILLERR